MKVYNFTITIEETLSDPDSVDAFYGQVDDASVEVSEGKTLIHFDRSAASLDDALHSAISEIAREGWNVCEISVEPDCLRPMSAS